MKADNSGYNFNKLLRYFNTQYLFDVVIKKPTYPLFCVLLALLYIGYGYLAENTVRSLNAEGNKLKEYKAKYTTSFTELEKVKRQSNIADNINAFGLVESVTPPYKIVVPKK
jgi:hypothetical protein